MVNKYKDEIYYFLTLGLHHHYINNKFYGELLRGILLN